MSLLDEAKVILVALGMPPAQQTDLAACTLLALAGVGGRGSWPNATPVRCSPHLIIEFVRAEHAKTYEREGVRRQALHQLRQGGVASLNPDQPDLPTNSASTRYALTDEALEVIRQFGAPPFDDLARAFRAARDGGLAARYARERTRRAVPVRTADGSDVLLSPGKHNELQKAIVEVFLPTFAPGSTLLYLGDTAQKALIMEVGELTRLGVPLAAHGKLPDVIAHDPQRNWLFLCEAVTSHGPVSPKRYVELEGLLQALTSKRVYVSAFPDVATYRRHLADIAWETEVWMADQPTHLVHHDGEHFISPTPYP